MILTTTANLVKNSGLRCEDADDNTQSFLTSIGADWDTELPILSGIKYFGLADTLICVGAAKQKAQAVQVLDKYMVYLYDDARTLFRAVDTEIPDHSPWLVNDDRAPARQRVRLMWVRLHEEAVLPVNAHLTEAMKILFSETHKCWKCVHAGKELLASVYPDETRYGRYVDKLTQLIGEV